MNNRSLETFAVWARRELMKGCRERLNYVLAHEKDPEFAEHAGNISILKREAKDAYIEKAAYTWFNRFIAFRFMDVRGFYSQRVLSPEWEDDPRPQLLADAAEGVYPRNLSARERDRVQKLLGGLLPSRDPQAESYRILFLSACRELQRSLPFLFDEVNAPMELLLPEDLLSPQSVIAKLRAVMDEDACQNVEVIGWLFQFYISEKKADIMKQKGAVSAEDLPARTQLFTPEWIVRYLVENSLGRLWLEHHPESMLADHMRYYINSGQESVISDQDPAGGSRETDTEIGNTADYRPPATDHLDVEDIKFCDPACGSGHILVYAFELLTHIYEEEGYGKKEIPALILRNNLFGLELDPRAGQLAAMALFFRACIYEPSFYRRVTGADDAEREALEPQIAILENIRFSAEEQKEYGKLVGKTLITQDLWLLFRQFEDAESLGSLIVPAAANLDAIEAAIRASGVMDNLLMDHVNTKLKKLLRLARFLSPRYHVICANPPYLGSSNLEDDVKGYAQDHYLDSKADLFSMFIERGLMLTRSGAYSAMVTMQSWMFLSSFEKLRVKLLKTKHLVSMAHIGPRGFDAIGGEVVQTTAFVFQNHFDKEGQGDYLRLIDGGNEAEKERMLLEAIDDPDCGWFYRTKAKNFSKIPGVPIAYWASEKILEAFITGSMVGKEGIARNGMKTGNNDEFLRTWWEIENNKFEKKIHNYHEVIHSNKKWFPYNKGGEFRKWYGNNDYVVNYENQGYRIFHDAKRDKRNVQDYPNDLKFIPAITWSLITSGRPAFRYKENHLSDIAGMSLYVSKEKIYQLLAFLNTPISLSILQILAPTINFQAGDIGRLPVKQSLYSSPNISILSKQNILLSKSDWDSFEISWDYSEHPLTKFKIRNQKSEIKFAEMWEAWQQECEERFQTLKKNEEELNHIFIEIYGLQDELTPEVDEKDVTVHRADLGRECRSLVSYALGCTFGRYDPNVPGLRYAGGPDPERDKYPVCLSLLDDEYSETDAVRRVKAFLREVYGDKNYVENLHFLEAGLGKDLRSYLRSDFYADHLKIYQKRPIYWLFSSPKGSFQALIYLHRYSSGTVSAVRQAARDYCSRLAGQAQSLQQQADAASGAERRKAEKQLTAVRSSMTEVKTWEKDVLAPLAEARIELDLDDGVKVNYAKFGDALAKIK